ncbi:MAG: helix-turn-helix domain-containing protein [Actinomycetota bacterium]
MRADDHGRKGSATFLRAAGYRPDIPRRELRRRAARERVIERARWLREARLHVYELAELGLSLRRIARAAGVSHQTVSNWLSERRERLVS